MTSAYAILATVTLQHDYFADGRCPDFDIVPSPETAAAMKGLSILTKTIGNTLIILQEVKPAHAGEPDKVPFRALPQDLKLCFYLELIQTDFINYTNLTQSNDSVYYFTNLYQTAADATRYLNQPLPVYSAAAAYEIGDMIQAGAAVYEAIKPIQPGAHAPADPDHAAYWYERSGKQYAHAGDALMLTDGVLNLDVAAAKTFEIKIFALNTTTLDFDILRFQEKQVFTDDVKSVAVHLQSLPPDKYLVQVNGVTRYVYLDQNAAYRHVFGMAVLYHHFPAAHDFRLTDAEGNLKGLDHVIRFPNRLAIWKYIARTTNVTAVENTAVPGAFTAGGQPKEFVSRTPLPLKQQPVKTLQVLHNATVLGSRLANPAPDRMGRYKDSDGHVYFCAEMYLNY